MESVSLSMVFEGIMVVCFGVSWPAAIWKTARTKTVAGVSQMFLWFVFIGYLAGILCKLADTGRTGHVSPVIVLYVVNEIMVGTEMVLFYRFRGRTVAGS